MTPLPQKKKMFMAILAIAAIYLLVRLVGLTLQPVFCDEAIYIHWAQEIKNNFQHNAFLPLTDGKTPLFMWLMVPFLTLFSDPLFAGRLLSVFSGLATLAGVMFLGKKFFGSRTAFLAGLFLAVIPFAVFFDKMALADSMLAAFSVWSLALALSLMEKISAKNIILLGLTLGGGILAKTPGIFSLYTLPLVLLTINFKKTSFKVLFKKVSALALSGGIGFGIYNLLRISPYFHFLSARNGDYYFPLGRLLITPFNPFVSHAADLADWLTKMLTPTILILAVFSLPLIFYKRNIRSLVILLWGILPAIAMMLLLKTFTARYLLFCIIPIIFLSAWAFNTFITMIPARKKTVLILISAFLFLTPSLFFDFRLMTDPTKANLPREERRGYFEDWTAGYGIKEIANFLKIKSQSQKILVVTEGSFGTLPDGIDIYLGENKNIEIWYGTSIIDPYVYEEANIKPVFFVTNKSRLSFNKNLRLINEYPKAVGPDGKADALMLFQLIP